MYLRYKDYIMEFKNGGLEIKKDNEVIYFNKKPLFVTVKTEFAINEFYNKEYERVHSDREKIIGEGKLKTPSGSEFSFSDIYTIVNNELKVSRKVRVIKEGKDLGFSTKISLNIAMSDSINDYDYFIPGVWYKKNEFAQKNSFGNDLNNEYFWRLETKGALPLFSMQHSKTGETVSISRWWSDVTMRSQNIVYSENIVDEKFTIGSLGMSKPKDKTLNYMYYGFAVRKKINTIVDGLSIDYVYPGCEGEVTDEKHYSGLDYKKKAKKINRVNHPVEIDFQQEYSVGINIDNYDNFQSMMRSEWRITYNRLRDKLFDVDNEAHYHNCMKILNKYTKKYNDSYGLPFACQLPNMDISSISFQFGFVGQQPGIGYQLIRYGDKENKPRVLEKGEKIIDFWVDQAMTESGLPHLCYNPNIKGFEPYPHYTRMIADGVEAIYDSYIYIKKMGEERKEWYEFCEKTANWLVNVQNADGSFYRAYNTNNTIRMESKSNTPSVIRFLVLMCLLTKEEKYLVAAKKAGNWSYNNAYLNLEYRGGTCDNLDIQDKEAGIYAMFGFLSLYDFTREEKWLEAAIGAADYTETWTYAWKFPVKTNWENHPFNKYSISGQSIITIGGGADVYMAACSYTYYRLYLITHDKHYLDFAEFIHNNTRQSNDIDGTSGYIMPGLGHESGNFTTQILESHYHWLPWCTYVLVDPTAKLFDTFGAYEISEIQKLSIEERERRNKIYRQYDK